MSTKIRFLHSCSKFNKFDIYLKDCILCPDLSYLGHSHYYDVEHGKIMFKICPPKKHYSILDAYTYVSENSYQTAIVTGLNGDLSLFVVPDAYIPLTFNKAFIRFVNLAPDKTLDFIVYDGAPVTFSNVGYKEATDYYTLYSDTYDIAVRISGTNNIFLTMKDVQLVENRFYTIYVFGFTRDANSPGYLIFTDGANQ
ncbi:MAG: hypothetical protein JM58_18570 [Peptococcaceae bacterium BICA1-8]|nr:MAG: hypothetical protein JM58_18570 [Peptococcaceae bacterium BICA1-8]